MSLNLPTSAFVLTGISCTVTLPNGFGTPYLISSESLDMAYLLRFFIVSLAKSPVVILYNSLPVLPVAFSTFWISSMEYEQVWYSSSISVFLCSLVVVLYLFGWEICSQTVAMFVLRPVPTQRSNLYGGIWPCPLPHHLGLSWLICHVLFQYLVTYTELIKCLYVVIFLLNCQQLLYVYVGSYWHWLVNVFQPCYMVISGHGLTW